MGVRTTVDLDKMGTLFDGRIENPFEVLGPHPVGKSGRRLCGTGILA